MRSLITPVARPQVQRQQRGTTLLEALVAFLVLSLGMLTVARMQTQLRLNSDLARQRSEAVRLGQEDLESLRAFSVVDATPGTRSYADVRNASRTVDSAAGYASATRYQLTRQIDAAGASLGVRARDAMVTVSWRDRSGTDRQIVLNSIIAGSDPSLTGALRIKPGGVPVKGALGRSARIPLGAKDLGGRSVFKPVSDGTVALLFDNASGLVIGRCSGLNSSTATHGLSPADLVGCDARQGVLLTGVVRFTSASPPDPGHATDIPLATTVAIDLRGGTYPTAPICASEALKTVSYQLRASRHIESVPLAALPSSVGVAGWLETGAHHLAYTCVVYPLASGQWSGRATLVPAGWSLGLRAIDRRVCRFNANIEHPAIYNDVTSSLAQQNFLVVNGGESCPTAPAVRVTGQANDVFVDLSTAPHQP